MRTLGYTSRRKLCYGGSQPAILTAHPDQGLFTLFLRDALRVNKVMRKARNAGGLDVRPGFATRRMAFLAATRRERGYNSATRCYAPSPGGQPGRRRAPRLALF